MRTKDDILILDPESEFGQLVKALGGEVLPISPHSSIHLNALDIDRAYGEGKTPLVDKVKLILSVFGAADGKTASRQSRGLFWTAVQGWCTGNIYAAGIEARRPRWWTCAGYCWSSRGRST